MMKIKLFKSAYTSHRFLLFKAYFCKIILQIERFCTVFAKRLKKIHFMNTLVSLISLFSLGFTSIFAQATATAFPNQSSEFGQMKLETTAQHKFKNQFSNYSQLSGISLANCAAVVYTAPQDGELNMVFNAISEDLNVAVFRAESINFDQELVSGNAFLLSFNKLSKGQNLTIDKSANNNLFEKTRFQVLKGQSILVFVSSDAPASISATPEIKTVKNLEARTKVDPFEFRKNKAGKTLKIAVRDSKTGLPVKARVNITGLKGLENIFNGSDLTFDLVTTKGAVFSCDGEGYFKTEVSPKLTAGVDNVVTVLMNSFDINENMRLDGVQFIEGTCEPLPTAFKDLDKLVDFMNANPSISIEVQGHVNAPDKGSRAAEKLSLTRAKYVRDYLIKKGINKDRIEFAGYGNTMMIYENPKTPEEEQANRRVEIRIFE